MSIAEAVLFAFAAEMIELYFQYAPTLSRMIARLYAYYRRSVFLLLLIHAGYIYILFLSISLDLLSWPLVLAIALKTFDIFSKIELIRKIHIKRESDPAIDAIMETPIPMWIFAAGPVTYPWLVYIAVGVNN